MDIQEVLSAISAGELDRHLRLIKSAATTRQQTIVSGRSGAPGTFQLNDRVVFNTSASPAYIRGAIGRVAGFAGTKLLVSLEQDAGRFRAGVPIKTPPAILTKVGA